MTLWLHWLAAYLIVIAILAVFVAIEQWWLYRKGKRR